MKDTSQIKGYVSNDLKDGKTEKGKAMAQVSVVEYVDKKAVWTKVEANTPKKLEQLKALKSGTYVKFDGVKNEAGELMIKRIESLDKTQELVGNVVRVGELQETKSNKKYLRMDVVEHDGNDKKYTNVTLWGKAAELATENTPGDKVAVKGEYKKNEVEKDGAKVVYTNFNANFIEKVKDVNEKIFVGAVISGNDDKLDALMDNIGQDKTFELLEDKKDFLQKGYSSHENVSKFVESFNKKFNQKVDLPDKKDFKFEFEGQKVNYQKIVAESKEATIDKGPSGGINM